MKTLKIEGTWEDPSEYSDSYDLCHHPAEAKGTDEDCERRWASVLPVDGKFQWQVGYVYFYPVLTDEGICDTLDEAKAKAEEVFVDKYVKNFKKTMKGLGL